MIVAIHQPQYLPWLGYFHKMVVADVFCLLDTVQYRKNEWQNRNRIKTANGWQWLTLPVSFKFPEIINAVRINNSVNWRKKHLQSLETNYRKAPFYERYRESYKSVYEQEWEMLSDLNIRFIQLIRESLGIHGKTIARASEFKNLNEDPTGRLIDICKRLGGDTYLSGASGPAYMDMSAFERNGLAVKVQEFEHPEYPQLFKGFESHLSIIDLLFNCGPDSIDIIKNG